jgi:hypothetical protein
MDMRAENKRDRNSQTRKRARHTAIETKGERDNRKQAAQQCWLCATCNVVARIQNSEDSEQEQQRADNLTAHQQKNPAHANENKQNKAKHHKHESEKAKITTD